VPVILVMTSITYHAILGGSLLVREIVVSMDE